MTVWLAPTTCPYCDDPPVLEHIADSHHGRGDTITQRQVHLVCPDCDSEFVLVVKLVTSRRRAAPEHRQKPTRGHYTQATADSYERWLTPKTTVAAL